MQRKYLRYVDMRSDTFTKPDTDMLDAMRNAEAGDDCYGEDPSVNELEAYAAEYVGKEAALYFPTGTMTNLVAMLTLVKPGEEMITDRSYHINFYESAQLSQFGGIVIDVCHAKDGILTVKKLKTLIDGKCRSSEWYTKPKIVVVENTINAHGGKVFPLDELKALYEYTSANGILLYMDGARLFEACAATGVDAKEYAKYTDCLAVCLSKGLGAPAGSMLLGKKDVIEQAKTYRKRIGGGFHQSGYMAAAGLHAIKHNVAKLKSSHENIQLLASTLRELPGINVVNAETNMVLIDVSGLGVDAKQFVALAKERGVLLIAWQENVVRFVTHMNVGKEDVFRAQHIVTELAKELLLPVADREISRPAESADALLALLQAKNIACEKSDKNPQVIQIKLDGKARRFCKRADEAGLEVGVATKDVVEVMVTAEFAQADLSAIAGKLAAIYRHYHKPVVAAASSAKAGMFAAPSHHKHHHRHHHPHQQGYHRL